MTPSALALRTTCLRVIAADAHAQQLDAEGPHPDFLRLARVLFALTASRDATVQAAIAAAVAFVEPA